MAVGEFALTQVVIRLASTLEQIRVICDRAHEEDILAQQRDVHPRALACHYAYALGTVMQVAMQQLDEVQRVSGLRRSELHADEANARARESLEAFKRQVRALELP